MLGSVVGVVISIAGMLTGSGQVFLWLGVLAGAALLVSAVGAWLTSG
jgi:hypothetical protein